VQAWTKQARAAEAALEGTGESRSREAAVAEVAARLGTTRLTLAKALQGLAIVDAVARRSSGTADLLSRLPLTLVDAYGRWVRRDRGGADAALTQAAAGKLSVRSFVAAERAARNLATEPGAPNADGRLSSFDQVLAERRRILEMTRQDIFALPLLTRIEEGARGFGLPPVPLRLLDFDAARDGPESVLRLARVGYFEPGRHRDKMARRSLFPAADSILELATRLDRAERARAAIVAVIELTDYDLLDRYRTAARPLLFRAVAASLLYPVVICLTRTNAGLAELLHGWPEFPDATDFRAEPDASGAAPDRLQADEREGSVPAGLILHPARCGGAIVVTSAPRFMEDVLEGGQALRQRMTRQAAAERDREGWEE